MADSWVPLADTYERAHYHGTVTHTCLIELGQAVLRTQVAAGDRAGAARTRASIKVLEASRAVRTRINRNARLGLW